MALEPDTRLGPYRIVSALGAGGMGVVYKAEDTRLGRPVDAARDDPFFHELRRKVGLPAPKETLRQSL